MVDYSKYEQGFAKFPERLEAVRLSKELTKAAVRRKTTLSKENGHRTILSWEQGKSTPTILQILEIATALDVDPVWLMFGDLEE